MRPIGREGGDEILLGHNALPTSLSGRQQNFAWCLAISWAGTLYTFLGTLAP